MSEWRDISTAPRDGVFVLLHNDRWSSDVEGFWHKGSQSRSANTRIPGIENRVISPEPPTHWKPLTVEEEKYSNRLSASSGHTPHSPSQTHTNHQKYKAKPFYLHPLTMATD